MRLTDEETLRDEVHRNPESTRWISKRGVVRKKQWSGKEKKRDVVDKGCAREMQQSDIHTREAQGRQTQARRRKAGRHRPKNHRPGRRKPRERGLEGAA